MNFINRLYLFAQQMKFCICIDVYKIYEVNDFNKTFEVLSEKKKQEMRN